MKLLFSIAFLITSCITAIAQQPADSSTASYATGDTLVRVTLHLVNQSSVAGTAQQKPKHLTGDKTVITKMEEMIFR